NSLVKMYLMSADARRAASFAARAWPSALSGGSSPIIPVDGACAAVAAAFSAWRTTKTVCCAAAEAANDSTRAHIAANTRADLMSSSDWRHLRQAFGAQVPQ